MFHVTFLICLAIVWIVFANVQDFKKNEIYNWISFSLIIFALAFRLFYSLFSVESSFAFFYHGLIGLAAFFVLANLLYQGRIFGAGDAKLMMALGAIVPFAESFKTNAEYSLAFFVLFLLGGAIYGLLATFYFAARNHKKFRKEFTKQFKRHQNILIGSIFLGLFFIILGFSYSGMAFFGIFVFVIPYLYIFANSVDRSCMIKKVSPKELVQGDLLFKDFKANGKTIKAGGKGLGGKDIELIRKHKNKVWIRYGIPYSFSFLIAFVLLAYLYINDLGINFITSLA